MGTRYRGITRAVYGPEVCWLTAGLTAFSNNDLNRDQFLVKFSEKIPGRSVENQHQLDKIKDLFFIEGFRQYLSKKIKYDLSSIKKIVTCILTGNRLFYGLNYNSHPVVFVNELFNFLKNESIVIKNKQTKLYCEKLSFQEKLTDFIEKNPMHKIAHSTSIIKDLTYKVDSFTVSEPRCTIELVDYAQNLQEIFPINEIESE